MKSERDAALKSVSLGEPGVLAKIEGSSEKIDEAIDKAESARESTRQLELSHQHQMNTLRAELGWFGKVFGSESHAAIVIAFIVIVLGFSTAITLWIAAYRTGQVAVWSSEAHTALAAATSALGFVFGRGSKDTK